MVAKRTVTAFFLGYGLILGLAAVIAMLLLVHGGGLLNFLYPALATIVALLLFAFRPSVYVAYVWWVWLFTPEVRRLVDFQTHYHNVSPVMVTPLAVTGLSLLAVLRHPQFLLRRSILPFSMLGLIFVYALLVGALTAGALPAAFDFANWTLPLAFGVFIMMRWDDFSEKRVALVFAMILGLLLTGAYGLYQFFHFPPWDAAWLANSNLSSEGKGVAEEIRLFGPLNSSFPYAMVLMSGLVFALVAKGPLRIAAAALGLPAFGLASVREAWGGWAVAALFIIWRAGGKSRMRILTTGAILALIITPLVTVGPVATLLSQRFSSISDLQQDSSYQARRSLYLNSAETAVSQPIGVGFGQVGVSAKLANGQNVVFDSGILMIPYEFGWFGTVLFVWAIGALSLRIFNASQGSKDRITIAAAGLFLGIIVQNIFSSTFGSVAGVSLWMGAALALGPAAVRRRVPAVRPAVLLNRPAQLS